MLGSEAVVSSNLHSGEKASFKDSVEMVGVCVVWCIVGFFCLVLFFCQPNTSWSLT